MLHFEFELLFVLPVVGVGILGILWKVGVNNSAFSFLKRLIQPGFLEKVLISSYCVVCYIFSRELSVMLRI